MIKNILKKITTKEQRKKLVDIRSVIMWFIHGQNPPAPHMIKRNILKWYAKKYNCTVFVETGTYMGDTVCALRNTFKKLFSIELDAKLYAKAKERFNSFEHISIIHGDSSDVLPFVLASIHSPTLFWLDGHYSGEYTGYGKLETPILQELEPILNHEIKNHTILIDDARLFVGTHDYPTLDALTDYVHTKSPHSTILVKNDIIRITP